jgi:D-inositol-3-phosphate glycosyltransferase
VFPRRAAIISVHTSPLEQPGGGDAGGMNVYILETSRLMAAAGVQVEIFTRATSSDQPRVVEVCAGVTVRHVIAGPFEGLSKLDLPAQLCAFSAGVLRAEAQHEPGWYDVIHSHYWLSGQVGWLARDRWRVPLVHTAHTLAKAKNESLAVGDAPEPMARLIGEQQVVDEADRLIANTSYEARQLVQWYGANPGRVSAVPPGVDLETFRPGSRAQARRQVELSESDLVLLFVGRLQPLKAPDVLIRAAAMMADADPDIANRLRVIIVGGPSGSGLNDPDALAKLAADLGVSESVRFEPPASRESLAVLYNAADLTVVPSHNESFGLVALESQACGTPVVAAAVGGLTTAVADGRSGVLIDGHDVSDWATVLAVLLRDAPRRQRMGVHARAHAVGFSWQRTTDLLLGAYREAMRDFAGESGVPGHR